MMRNTILNVEEAEEAEDTEEEKQENIRFGAIEQAIKNCGIAQNDPKKLKRFARFWADYFDGEI